MNVEHAPDPPFAVVFVCTGNRARSPLAEALYRRHSSGIETHVSSFGTVDLGPVPALSEAIRAAESLGVDLSHHRAAALQGDELLRADLVLGFEPHHVSTAVVDGRADPARTFLLAELVSLLERAPAVAHGREAVGLADSQRMRFGIADTAFVIADPLGRSDAFMSDAALRIDRLVRTLVVGLFGSRGTAASAPESVHGP